MVHYPTYSALVGRPRQRVYTPRHAATHALPTRHGGPRFTVKLAWAKAQFARGRGDCTDVWLSEGPRDDWIRGAGQGSEVILECVTQAGRVGRWGDGNKLLWVCYKGRGLHGMFSRPLHMDFIGFSLAVISAIMREVLTGDMSVK